jgi:hypothetical protein
VILDMADVKPTLLSWIIVTLMAVSGILVLKAALNARRVPGLTDAINAV